MAKLFLETHKHKSTGLLLSKCLFHHTLKWSLLGRFWKANFVKEKVGGNCLPKLSHQLLKGQSFWADGASTLKQPAEKENLSPHFDETSTSIQDHLKMSEFLAETLQLMKNMPKSFTYTLACPGINNGLSSPYVWCSANHTKAKGKLSVSLGRQEHMLFSVSLFPALCFSMNKQLGQKCWQKHD